MATEIPSPSRDQMLAWYRQMYLIRRFEELAAKSYTQRKIMGFCHLYIGQEAVAVGSAAALRPSDTVVSAYRVHGHVLARGAEPRAVMAELFGKAPGICKGLGGSMHMADPKLNFFGGYGIVGGHIPLAVGAAFASRYNGKDDVALVYFGDGAAQQGAFFEAMAIAQLWKLPVVFLLENNYYAMGTSLERQSYLTDLARRGDGVGMAQWQVQGFDVVEFHASCAKAVEHARSGQGPVLLEAITYRYRGHSMSDPAKYRKAGELDEKKKQDALHLAEVRLGKLGVEEAELTALRTEIDHVCEDAVEFADGAPQPDPHGLYDYNLTAETH
jgi:pyruvate dehydrogenase E1 component alpha subunit